VAAVSAAFLNSSFLLHPFAAFSKAAMSIFPISIIAFKPKKRRDIHHLLLTCQTSPVTALPLILKSAKLDKYSSFS